MSDNPNTVEVEDAATKGRPTRVRVTVRSDGQADVSAFEDWQELYNAVVRARPAALQPDDGEPNVEPAA